MGRDARRLVVFIAAIVGGLGCASSGGALLDVQRDDQVARLRPASAFERQVIAEGLCGSGTFRALVEELGASDLIVYVSMRRLGSRDLRGRLEFLGATATDRIVRAMFAFPLDRQARITTLGHELRHAIEVARAPEIRSARAFDTYFRTHGHSTGLESAYDTDAAHETEIRIREELTRASRCGV
jgi:hypothetical protein